MSVQKNMDFGRTKLFKRLYKQYRKDFKRYVPHFETRTEGQIKSFYQNIVHKNKQIKNSSKMVHKVSTESPQEQAYELSQGFSTMSSIFESTTITFDNLDAQQ
ncbi:SANT/Myb_domain [Hexamita inflata]|uniref:SANT/Myb domain n=1 Tax=Hexamita inflata TaxID=28002 RepID=A0AA86QV52_9EUKA|nr:SANT/Myb domain [Hexamita inflata]